VGLAAAAFVLGAVVAAQTGGADARKLAEEFATNWTRSEYGRMYSQLDPATRRGLSRRRFERILSSDVSAATATKSQVAGRPRSLPGGRFEIPVRVHTRLFGTLVLPYELRISSHEGTPLLAWSDTLAFPGLRPGERLTRHTNLPRRATLLARDGSVLAETPQSASTAAEAATRSSPLGNSATALLGEVGALPASRRSELEAMGVPPEGPVGTSGIEFALDDLLRGTPGGELLAGTRPIAYAAPHPAAAVRTSISPTLQEAAVTALGGQYGGVVAMRPDGQILGVAGIGLEGLQPPGSTFKMVTLSGVLAAHIANPQTVFPYATFATLDGVKLSNANGEECGGTLELAFAVSCNSVFTPLGVKLGAPRLVASAERFGFNHPTGIRGAPPSTLPAAGEIQGELDVGSTAIGQGQVLATPLGMATVAATIADEGTRPQPTFLPAAPPPAQGNVVSRSVALTVRRLMEGVVRNGTGTAAAIPGVTVAGKTGTAELKSACPSTEATSSSGAVPAAEEHCRGGSSQPENTDAWFAAFAPAIHPHIVVCVLLVKDGAGGATAAPVAREVLEAGLRAHL
jgi:cell division protein FtsI/penicillin-binding protein 2